MSTRRHSRSRMAPSPALPPGTSLAKIKRLPAPTIALYLNQYHLAQGGTKAERLYDHLQALQPDQSSSGQSSSGGSGAEEDVDSADQSSQDEDGASRTNSDPDPESNTSDRDEDGQLEIPATTDAPFTRAQQKTLTETVKSAIKASKSRKRPRPRRSPTISSPSDNGTKGRRSRHTRLKRVRDSRCSSSSSSSRSSSLSPSTGAAPHLAVIAAPAGPDVTTIVTGEQGSTNAVHPQSHGRSGMLSNEVSS